MKKVLAMLLCGSMILTMLVGCGGGDVSQSSSDTMKSTKTKADDAAEDTLASADLAQQAIDERKAKAEKTGSYEKVVVSFFDWTGAPAGIDRINEQLSAYTEETLGLDVELMIIDSAAYSDNMKLMLSSGEQVDIFSSCGPGYTTCVNNGYTLELEEDLLSNYGQGITQAVRAEYLDACRIGDVLYGIPPIKDYAIQTAAICIGTEYLDTIGYDYASAETDDLGYIKCDWSTIDDIFAQLHEKYTDKYILAIQDNGLTQGSSVDPVGGDYYGALLNPTSSLTVEDTYTSDIFKEWCERAYAWNQAGYISKDALTDDTGASAKVKSGAYLSMMACSKPGYQTQITGECGRDMTVFDVGEGFMSSSSVSAFPWCINQNTEDPIATMQVLNALYSDSTVSNLLCWGQEGYEYQVNNDQTITYADGVDANTSEYYPNVVWMMPNPYVAHVWEGDSLEIGKQISDFNDNCPNKSIALGFTWDNGDYSSEYTALQNAYDQFGKTVTYGFIEPEEGIAQLEKALKAAGLDRYIAAKQEALNTWAAENNIQ